MQIVPAARLRRTGVLAAVVALLATLLPGTPARADAADAVPGPVVLVGTGGVTWADVPADDPVLGRFVRDGTIGAIAVRGVRSAACPVDGWLAVSAGRRAGDASTTRDEETGVFEPYCRPLTLDVAQAGGAAEVPRWDVYRTEAADGSFEADPGLLGATLAAARVQAAAVGPGAAIALADRAGTSAATWSGTDLQTDVVAAVNSGARLVVVDVGAVRDPEDLVGGEPTPQGDAAAPVADQVTEVTRRIGVVLDSVPDDATVLVASLADAGQRPHLQLLGASGPKAGGGDYAPGVVWTTSTRQRGLLQTTDLTPTLLGALGLDVPASAVGAQVGVVPAESEPTERYERVLDLDRAAQSVRPIVPWFFNGLVVAQLVLYGAATVALRRDRPDPVRRGRTLRKLRAAAVVFASVPAATFLANLLPWWRFTAPGLSVTAAVILFVVPIAALALLGPWRHRLLGPFGIVAGVTAAVLAGDVLSGSHLMLSSLMGVQPVVAGRFYGFSNPGFALFATGALLLATALADGLLAARRRTAAVAVVAVVGVVATVIDGAPGWGSDFGGPPAMVPAFAVLALLVAGVRITWGRAVVIAAATVVVVVGLSVLDWLRPAADRTHLGRFVQTVIDGGAWPVIQRKAEQNLSILTSSPLSWMLPFAVAFVALVLARPSAWGVRPLQLAYDRSPALQHGLVSFAVLVGIGFALNDSGTAIPAVAATVFIPLLIAASSRALEMHEEETGAVLDADGPRPPRWSAGATRQPPQEA